MIKLFRVSGSSMQPTLKSGDVVIAIIKLQLKVGKIYVVESETGQLMIKRLKQIDSNKLSFEGDNNHQAHNITVRADRVKYRIWLRLP